MSTPPSSHAVPPTPLDGQAAGIHDLIRQAPDAVIVIDAKSDIQLWNPKAEIIFGWEAEEVIGKPLAETIIPPTLRDAHRSGMARYLSTGEAHVLGKAVGLVALHRAGHQFPVSVTISPFNTAGERRFVAFLRDVTTEKENEATLEQNRKDLIARNQELEQYAWLVSHDLKEPLRKVSMFADTLQERFSENLPGEAVGYLEKMVSATDRMRAVIDAVLAYANVSRVVEEKTAVSLPRIVSDALVSAELLVADTGARITVRLDDAVPPVLGSEVQLAQVFENLLCNAMKYHRADVAPEIIVEAKAENGRVVATVRDNGVGFHADYAEQIFAPFQRLQSRDGAAGTGMGLSLCRKIVEAHGGRIWAESAEGSGSTFFVELPMAE